MTHWPYLPFLLVWAAPVIALQWIVGARYLWRERHLWLGVVLGLTAYFTFADAVAIDQHIWTFDTRALLGIYLGPVPVEEILFYFLTATMVVQGFMLIWHGWNDRRTIRARWASRLARRRYLRPAPTSPPTPSRSGEPMGTHNG